MSKKSKKQQPQRRSGEKLFSNYQMVMITGHILAIMLIPLLFIMAYLLLLDVRVSARFAMTVGGIVLLLVAPAVRLLCPQAYRSHQKAKKELESCRQKGRAA